MPGQPGHRQSSYLYLEGPHFGQVAGLGVELLAGEAPKLREPPLASVYHRCPFLDSFSLLTAHINQIVR